MIKKTQGFIEGIKNIKYIFKALYDTIIISFKITRLFFKHISIIWHLKTNIKLSLSRIRESYMFVDNPHLEVNPFSGIFLQNTHRLKDTYPLITIVDKSQEIIEDTFLALDGTFCHLNYFNIDITKESLEFDLKYDSISLSFVLDEINGIDNIDKFFNYLKSLLKDGAIIFGVTIAGKDPNLSKKTKNYVRYQNKQKKWFNENTSLEDLEMLFEKHFDNIGIVKEGDTIIFRVSNNKPKKNLSKYRPTLESVEGKKIIIDKKKSKSRKTLF